MIRSINGVCPYLRVALQAYFDSCLSVRIDNPSETEAEALEIELDVNAALSRYYAVAMAMATKAATREQIQNQEYVTRFDEDSGITIGLEASIFERVSAGQFEQVRANQKELITHVSEIDASSAVYPDGLFVRLDDRWSSQLMALEPEKRDG